MPRSQLLKLILKEQAQYEWPPSWHFTMKTTKLLSSLIL